MKASFHIHDPHSERVTRIGRLHAAPARSTAALGLMPILCVFILVFWLVEPCNLGFG
ncbi:cytochrome c oxidase subunit 2A [Varibaculum cambriense]|uniref:cytochrome c oxidase subunit 2A n=1 Tax=Varibaculum cambriense TaxID=184870 RepID=UPI0037DD08AD